MKGYIPSPTVSLLGTVLCEREEGDTSRFQLDCYLQSYKSYIELAWVNGVQLWVIYDGTVRKTGKSNSERGEDENIQEDDNRKL
jgi:hypothetical protein